MSAEQLSDLPESLAAAIGDVVDDAAKVDIVDEPKGKAEDKPKIDDTPDPLVEKARASGWRPKEEFEGDPDQWVDAGEFVRRKPLFDQLHTLKKQLSAAEKQQQQLAEFAANAAKRARAEALAEIEAQKQQAFEAGDYKAFSEAEQKAQQLQQVEPRQQVPAAPEIPQEVQDFAKRNERWFEKDRAMTAYAVDMAREYIEQGGKTREEALRLVEADVKREFAHKFVNPNKDKAAAVVSENGDKRGAGKLSINDLTKEQRSVWNSLKNHMTFEEYAKELGASS
jgi:hypothetical protein